MTQLVIERHFNAPPERVFAFVSKSEHLLSWWGPEGMHIPDGQLDFTTPGPWYSVMQNAGGGQYKVSGEVVAVDTPNSVEFTWGWHDDADQRGDESRVRFTIVPGPKGGSTFTLIHSEFKDTAAMGNHEGGWTSSLRKLEAKF